MDFSEEYLVFRILKFQMRRCWDFLMERKIEKEEKYHRMLLVIDTGAICLPQAALPSEGEEEIRNLILLAKSFASDYRNYARKK